ncbi:MAG: glycosyltransferase [Flavobacteriales bacterium]|nr:glycosyltransferase [Flavobacteriales bacterium]
MKIFVLVSRVPWPLEKGDKLRAWHHVKHLSSSHEVFLCCLSDSVPHPAALHELQKIAAHVQIIKLHRVLIGWRIIRALFSDKPYQVHYFLQNHALRKVKRLVNKFSPDHIYTQLVRTAEYVKHLHHLPKTLDYMDALSAGQWRRSERTSWWMKFFTRTEAQRLRAYENLIFDYFEHHTIISTQDRDLIYHPQRNNIHIIPNGVDSTYFHEIKREKKFDIVFTGNMSYPPNMDCAKFLALEILPLLQAKRAGTTLHIAGATPSRHVKELQTPYVVVSGWLDDIRDAYSSARVFTAPMQIGTGMQNKLLEAMSMNLPCVTTPIAASALGALHQEHLLIGKSKEEIASHILSLLADEEWASSLAQRGQQHVRSTFDWAEIVCQLATIMMNDFLWRQGNKGKNNILLY